MYILTNLTTGTRIEISGRTFELLEKAKEDSFKRRSRLYVPLTCEKHIDSSNSTPADGLIFDLEDSVPHARKSMARKNVRKIPKKTQGVEYILRINAHSSDFWERDLDCLEDFPFDSVMIPKIESARQLEEISSRIDHPRLSRIALIETFGGLDNAREIAEVLSPGDAMGYGAGDLSTSFGIVRKPIQDSFVLRQCLFQVLKAARASGLDVFDPPYRDYSDPSTLTKEALFGRECGTTGKQAIHPCQIDTINRVYSPSDEEITGYSNELTGFADQGHSNAISLQGAYRGLPSKILAERKLIDYVRRGYIRLEPGK
ncbi:CoA ester lyase [Gammaproteobacteria bacterium]|nr:CoA ester lyase [Gammaproteobacteria bacterium]